MEFHNPIKLSVEAATGVLAFILVLYCLVRWKRNDNNNKYNPPQPSGSWPIIGHLPLLGRLPHITLGKLVDKYGPIFMIKLGFTRALVVSSAEMAKECLGTNDKVFLSRPHKMFVELMGYKSALWAMSPYGQYWREMRKITTIEVLSNHRIEMFKDVRISEVRSALKVLFDDCRMKGSSSVEMNLWLNNVSLNIMVRLIAGKLLTEFYQAEKCNQYGQALRDFFELAGAFVPADALPFLRRLDIGGYEKNMKTVAKEIDQVAQMWLEDHKTRSSKVAKEKDFIHVMLGIFETEQEKLSEYDEDTIIKAASMTLILAGSDTTSVTLTWALSLLLNNKDVLRKTQAELDNVVGKERNVDESDLKNLVYLQAVLKETMRLYPPGPLSVPREAITDCTVSGYHIPAGTQLFVNLYKIHRDPQVWEHPLDFEPERFLTTFKDYDVRGQSYEYLPFGSGRRMCPGISFALQVMQFTLASLLHGFKITTPSDETVDMTERFGLTNVKATPLEVVLTHRLPHNLY